MQNDQPIRIVVELVQSADVKALEARDEDLKKEVAELRRRVDGLHKVLFEAMEALRGYRSK